MAVQIYNLQAESSCLSSILYDNNNYDLIFGRLNYHDFYDSKNKIIAKAIQDYKKINPEKVIDLVSLTDFLTINQEIEKAGGSVYFNKLLETYVSSSNVETYVSIIAEKSLFRNLLEVSNNLKIDLSSPKKNTLTKDILENIQSKLYNLEKKQYGGYSNINDLARTSIEDVTNFLKSQLEVQAFRMDFFCRGIPTRFNELDKIISGLQKTHLVIIGGRTGMGKTLFMISLAQNIGINHEGNKKAVGIFSLEMSEEELMNRILFSQAGISYQDFLSGGFLSEADPKNEKLQKLMKTADHLKDKNKASIYIDDTSRTTREIEATARRMVRENQVEVIFIDYIQFISPEKDQMRMPREQQIATFSNDLKQLAKRLKVPIICLAQVNREVEKKGAKDRVPQLSHLRDSGALEQDADVVMFVYRERAYKEESLSNDSSFKNNNITFNEEAEQESLEREAQINKQKQMMNHIFEVFVRKNRHGNTGHVYLKQNLSQFKLTDIRGEELEKVKEIASKRE